VISSTHVPIFLREVVLRSKLRYSLTANYQYTWTKKGKAANDLFSCAVSTIREPIESFFNWFNEKVKIQNAQKVRSTAVLIVHIFAKMAAAFIYLVF